MRGLQAERHRPLHLIFRAKANAATVLVLICTVKPFSSLLKLEIVADHITKKW
jgi:hypothetical protein